MNHFGELTNFIWSVADLIRDVFKRGKYQDVILPFTVLRRLDCVLEPTKTQALTRYSLLRERGVENVAPQLSRASGFAFYNTSRFTFERLLEDPPHLADNLRAYINGFSDNMREVLEKFDFHNTITKLDDANLLFLVMQRFKTLDLHPDTVSNHQMGYVFEDLIRRFNEAMNENPGEHFTPREVIGLMVDLLIAPDQARLRESQSLVTVYDPCCGSGGMLTTAKDRLTEVNPYLMVRLFGQEVNPETFAVCKSDLYMKSVDGQDAEGITFGSTLSNDQHADKRFDYLLANPPYGKEWKMDQDAVEAEAERGHGGRFGAGTPRISDGQLLFLQHKLSRMEATEHGGSRVAIVMNGSPLFTGDAGSGESEIRRWILENDWLETIVALPEQLFYNTGIATYIWVLSNRKASHRTGRVQLINATGFWTPMRKSLGDKRREISPDQLAQIVQLASDFTAGEHTQIFDTTHFGYRKITVERPLRLNFQASPERIERLKEQKAYLNLAVSKKKIPEVKAAEEAEGRKHQKAILRALETLASPLNREPGGEVPLFKSRDAFEAALRSSGVKLTPTLKKAILTALSERDETAEICRDKAGHPEPDPERRDTENVPLTEDPHTFFEREVKPHLPDAWLDTKTRDPKDGEIGRVGYEINFNRYFYQYTPPRPLTEIEADIKTLEREILDLLAEVTG
jgi:type I restriction enzyme M protein